MREWPQRPHSITCDDRGRHCGKDNNKANTTCVILALPSFKVDYRGAVGCLNW